jgi:hypothetical protein
MPDNKQLIDLLAARDFLTEAFLRPERSSFLRPHLKLPFRLASSGIVGFGVGGQDESQIAISVFVDPKFALTKEQQAFFYSMDRPFKFQQGRFLAASRPVKGGHSMGHGTTNGETGTMGCVVKNDAGERFGLSCNHVIADLNKATRGKSEVWCPGSSAGGTVSDKLGVLHDFVDLAWGGTTYNDVDTAIALPDDRNDLDSDINGIGAVNGWTSTLNFGDEVRKSGAETGVTTGKYRYQINGLISYSSGNSALFRNLLGIIGTSSDFAKQGDSGAVVVDKKTKIVGQVLAVTSGTDLTLASPIEPVLNHLKVEPL